MTEALRTLPKKIIYIEGTVCGMLYACNPMDDSEIWGSIKCFGSELFKAYCRRRNGDRLTKDCESLESAKQFIEQNAECEAYP